MSPTPQQPEPSALDPAGFPERLWQALKDECCSNPATAYRIVLLNEDQFLRAYSSASAHTQRALTAAETELRATKDELAREREDMRLRCADYDYQHETATALRAELASERAAGAWIATDDKLPEPGATVFYVWVDRVFFGQYKTDPAPHFSSPGSCRLWCGNDYEHEKPSHWMPAPMPALPPSMLARQALAAPTQAGKVGP